MESILKQAAKYGSNNTASYGIVNAVEVSGFKQVAALADLYKIADCILQKDKEGDGSDAVGQKWYVQATKFEYQLISWANRKTAAGWQKVEVDLSSKQDAFDTGAGLAFEDSGETLTLQPATSSTIGGIIVGGGLTIDASGKLSATVKSSYTLPAATASALGGVKIGSGINVTSDGVISVPSTSIATNTQKGSVVSGNYHTAAATQDGEKVSPKAVSTAAALNNVTTTDGRYYMVESDLNGIQFVNVPWSNTTYKGSSTIKINPANAIYADYTTVTTKGVGCVWKYYSGTAAVTTGKVITVASAAPSVNTPTAVDGKYYGIEADVEGRLFVNVPWSNTNTTYTATNGLTLTGTAFGLSDTTQGLINHAIKSNDLSNIAKLDYAADSRALHIINSAGNTTYMRMTGYLWTVANYGASTTVTQDVYDELLKHMQLDQQIFIHTDGYTYSCTMQEHCLPSGATKETLLFDIITINLVKYQIVINGDTLAVTNLSVAIAKKSDIPSLNGYATTESVTSQITKATGDLESEITAAANAAAAAQTTANAAVAKTSAYYFKAASQSGNKLTLTKGDGNTFTYTPTFDTPEQVYTLEGFDILDAASTVYTQGQIAELKNAILAGKIIKLADIGDTDSSATQVLAINASASDTSVEFAYTTGVGNNQVLVIVTIDLTKSSISTKTITSLNENDVTAISADVINKLS